MNQNLLMLAAVASSVLSLLCVYQWYVPYPSFGQLYSSNDSRGSFWMAFNSDGLLQILHERVVDRFQKPVEISVTGATFFERTETVSGPGGATIRGPFAGCELHISLLYLAIAFGLAAVVSFRLERALSPASGHCRKCGYDLRATPGRCPECGTVPEPLIGPLTHAPA